MSRRKTERIIVNQEAFINLPTGETVTGPSVSPICERIRYYRKKQGMEQKDFANRIGAMSNAVSNWERGRARPDVSMLPAICEVLGISLDQLFGQETPKDALTERENALISGYRELDSGDRHTVDILVKTMVTVRQARIRQKRRQVYELPLMDRSLAAGIGDPSEYEGHTTPFYVYDVPWLERTDCIFQVNGDSMEPEYHDGDYVAVERIPEAPELREGETGAFAVQNELYIKRYEKDGLHSLNPAYPVMKFSEDTKVYLIGRVVGKAEEKDRATEEDIELYRAIQE